METNRENLTLTAADLAACKPLAGEGGHVLRALCPFHGSDHQRSLRVALASGRFVCFACGAWGYLEEARQRWREEQQRLAALRRPPARAPRRQRQRPRPLPAATRPAPTPTAQALARPELARQLAAFQAALPGSRGEAYLRQRGIPLALAQQLGVGYAAPGTWPHAARDWRGGRVVFPHTTPAGRLVNLYGRAVGTAEEVPKAKRHDHLPGEKGYFNAAALLAGAGPLWVCEGAFDALALLAAGVPRVVAIFGVQGWRGAWARAGPPGGAAGQAGGGAAGGGVWGLEGRERGLGGGGAGRGRLGRQAAQQPGLCCPCRRRLPEIRVPGDGVPLPGCGLGALDRGLGGALLQTPQDLERPTSVHHEGDELGAIPDGPVPRRLVAFHP